MEENINLLEKRKELKHEISMNTENILTSQVFNKIGQIIQVATRRKRRTSWFISAILLFAAIWIPSFAVIELFHEAARYQVSMLPFIMTIVSSILGMLWTDKVIRFLFTNIREKVVDSIESTQDLVDLGKNLDIMWNMKKARVFIFIWSIFWLIATVTGYYLLTHSFFGFGLMILILSCGVCTSFPLYFVVWILRLPSHLGKYQYAVYQVNPASSEIIYTISWMLNATAFMMAIYIAYATFTTVFIGGYEWYFLVIILVFFSWIPLIYFFISIQRSLSRIITDAKWKICRDIQNKVGALRKESNFGQKENIEAISQLMSFHDQIKGTRNSALDFKTILNLFNQLLLPILGYLVANLDKIIDFFR